MATNAMDMAALNAEPVTEGHARICRERGHATYKVDGVDQGWCPRCGEVTNAGAGEEATVERFAVGSEVSVTTAQHVATYMPDQWRDVAAWHAGAHWFVCPRATLQQDCPRGHVYTTALATVREDDGGRFVGVTLADVPLAWIERERVSAR